MMKLHALTADIHKIKADSLVKFCSQIDFRKDNFLAGLDKILGGAIGSIFRSGEFEGRLNQSVVIHTGGRISATRLILVGLGAGDNVGTDSYRQAAGTISRLTAIRKSKTLAFLLVDNLNEHHASAIMEGFLLGGFRMTEYKTGDDNEIEQVDTIFIGGESRSHALRLETGFRRGQVIAEGVIIARKMAAHPANVLTPASFANEARALARKYHFTCSVLNEQMIKKERMGLLMAVAQGSFNPPRFVVLKYDGAPRKATRPIVLVGKGVTFDSGGLSLKERLKMVEMKGDMQGGAVVLATIMTIARLKFPLNVVGLIPLVENMPSGRAYRPDDIITSRKGKTVEIISTDAEGRLILADALDYADKFKPQAVIDIATLTGAALYVLGYTAAPVMGNNKKLMDALRAASIASAEKIWEMPIWDEYRNLMKSPLADLKNSGGPPAATITAGAFLENFIGDWPWAHIDIAYVDVEKDGRPYVPRGTSGVGLRLLVELLAGWKIS
nr:leucyl aminopeptidase [candidate division Zixibacteria bacterium]